MSTHTQSCHWDYTNKEWSSKKHQKYLDIIFKDNNIKYIYDIGANVGGTTFIFKEYSRKNNKNIEGIYCFEPDDENMNFLRSKLNDDINSGSIFTIDKGVYYGKNQAKVYGCGLVSENKIHGNVGGYGIDECMEEVVKNRRRNGEDVFCGQVDDKVF